MDVNSFFESFNHFFIIGGRRQNPKLNLRIIKSRESEAWRRDKRVPDSCSKVAPNRNILKIGLFGRKPAGYRSGLFKSSVNFAVAYERKFRNRINVGRKKFI